MKTYTIVLNSKFDSDSFVRDMEGVHYVKNIPSRECAVNRIAKTRCAVCELTEKEAMDIAKDTRVNKVVELKNNTKVAHCGGGPSDFERKVDIEFQRDRMKNGDFVLKPKVNFRYERKPDSVSEIQSLALDKYASISGLPGGSGVDVVVVDGTINPNNPEMKNEAGVSRFRPVNWNSWSGLSGSYSKIVNVFSEDDNHGQHVAGTVCGRLQGWAKQSDIYNIYPYDSNLYAYLAGLKNWHLSKSNGNPTITNHSYATVWTDLTDTRYILSVTINGTKTNAPRGDTGAIASCSLNPSGGISSFSVLAPGANYRNPPDVSFYGGGRDSATAIMANNSVYMIHVTNKGSGYSDSSPPTVTFGAPPSGGTRATGRCVVSGGKISAVVMTNRGSGYASAPTMTFGPPGAGGVQATGTTTLSSKFITQIMITNGGSGHTSSLPSLVISGGGCSVEPTWVIDNGLAQETVATGVLQNGLYKIVENVETVSSSEFKQTPMGGYYLSTPTISFLYQKDSADGPYAVANVSAGGLSSISISSQGSSAYDTPPNVVITNGGGFTVDELRAWGIGDVVESSGHYYVVETPIRDVALDSLAEDLISAGVVVVSASGNAGSRVTRVGDQGYNDVFEYLSYTHAMANPSILEQSNPIAAVKDTITFAQGSSPSAADGVICVGSLKSECCPETKSDFSNAGSRVDVYASGGQIMSCVHSSAYGAVPHPADSGTWMNKYSGTSMASPQVAGAIACYAEGNRGINQMTASSWLISNATQGITDGSVPYSLFGGADKILRYPGLTVNVMS